MTIGELFINLGFVVKGEKALKETEEGMESIAKGALKATLVVNALNVGLLALMNTATAAAVAFKNYALQTGLSTDELQKWQHIAAVNDVSAQEMTETLKGLQTQATLFRLNEPQAVGAWSMLGVNPLQNPEKVLEDLRLKLRTLSPELGRTLAEKIGINDNIFQMLVATNKQLEALNKNYIITKDQIKALRDLDGQWRNLKWSVEQVKNQFAAALAPALAILAQALEKVVGYLAMFAQWITADTYAAKGFRLVLGVVTIGALALGAALAMLATAFAVLAVAPAIAAITTALVEFLLPFAPIIAVIGALLLLLDDANTAFTGGQSFFGKDQWTQALMGLTNITRSLKIVYDLIVAVSQAIQNPARTMKQLGDTFDSATGRMLTSLNPISNALRIVLGPWKEIGQAIEQAYIKTKLFVTLFANMTGITAMLHRVKESLSGIFSWTDKIAALNPLPPGLKMLHDMWTAIASAIESAYTKVKLFLEVISGASNLSKMFERIAQAIPGIGAAATDKSLGNIIPSKSTASNTSNQTNAIQVHVEGSGDPVATGKHVVNNIAKAVQTAYRQMPNPAY